MRWIKTLGEIAALVISSVIALIMIYMLVEDAMIAFECDKAAPIGRYDR